jgi:hypothetical protein
MAIIPRSKEDVIANILSALGHGKVAVELTPGHLTDSYEDAVRWFIVRKGMKRTYDESFIPEKQEYDVPPDVDEVVNVIPPSSGMGDWFPYSDAVENGYRGIPIRHHMPAEYDYSGVVQQFQHAEMSRRVLGYEFDWEWRADIRKLMVYLKFGIAGKMQVEYISTEIDFYTLPVRMIDIITRRAIAEAKGRLGHIRGKYSDWMMAGGPKSMDGDSLLNEARDEMEALDKELDDLSYPASFIVR